MRADRTSALLACGDRACVERNFIELSQAATAVAALLAARLEVLARQIVDLIDDGDLSLADEMWKHLAARARYEANASRYTSR
jgi:hypothetical protein